MSEWRQKASKTALSEGRPVDYHPIPKGQVWVEVWYEWQSEGWAIFEAGMKTDRVAPDSKQLWSLVRIEGFEGIFFQSIRGHFAINEERRNDAEQETIKIILKHKGSYKETNMHM